MTTPISRTEHTDMTDFPTRVDRFECQSELYEPVKKQAEATSLSRMVYTLYRTKKRIMMLTDETLKKALNHQYNQFYDVAYQAAYQEVVRKGLASPCTFGSAPKDNVLVKKLIDMISKELQTPLAQSVMQK